MCIHFNTYVRGAGTRQTMNEWEYNQVCFFLQNSKRPMGFSKNYFAAGLTVFGVWCGGLDKGYLGVELELKYYQFQLVY